MNAITITAFIKDGGTKALQLPDEFLAQLAFAIQIKGVEMVHLRSESIQVVGFMITGKEIGRRVIVLGEKGDSANE